MKSVNKYSTHVGFCIVSDLTTAVIIYSWIIITPDTTILRLTNEVPQRKSGRDAEATFFHPLEHTEVNDLVIRESAFRG